MSISYDVNTPIKWGDILGNKKMGRPTDNPKDISLKVRFDKDTAKKLDKCVEFLKVSKAEVMRRGVNEVYNGLPK